MIRSINSKQWTNGSVHFSQSIKLSVSQPVYKYVCIYTQCAYCNISYIYTHNHIISYHIIPYDKYHNMVIYAVIYIFLYIYIKWGMICFHAESINRSTRRSCWSFTFAWDLRRSKAALPSARWKASLSKEWVNVVNLWGGLGLWHLPPGKLTAGPWKSPIVNGN